MTFVAHSIVGATVAASVAPKKYKTWQKVVLILTFIVLANFPDLKFPEWGHSRYDISHSIFANLILFFLVASPFLFSSRLRQKIGGIYVVVGAGIVWLSHLFLDSLYGHGHGIAIFWPFSKAHLALPIPFFEPIKKAEIYFDSHSIKVFAIETAFFGAFSVLTLMLIHFFKKQKSLHSAEKE